MFLIFKFGILLKNTFLF